LLLVLTSVLLPLEGLPMMATVPHFMIMLPGEKGDSSSV
jgi:hypothetical protein